MLIFVFGRGKSRAHSLWTCEGCTPGEQRTSTVTVDVLMLQAEGRGSLSLDQHLTRRKSGIQTTFNDTIGGPRARGCRGVSLYCNCFRGGGLGRGGGREGGGGRVQSKQL